MPKMIDMYMSRKMAFYNQVHIYISSKQVKYLFMHNIMLCGIIRIYI